MSFHKELHIYTLFILFSCVSLTVHFSAVFSGLFGQVHDRQHGVVGHQVPGVSGWLLSGSVRHEHVLQLSWHQWSTQPQRVVLKELLSW